MGLKNLAKCDGKVITDCYNNIDEDAIRFAEKSGNPFMKGKCGSCQLTYSYWGKREQDEAQARVSTRLAREKASDRRSRSQALEDDKTKMSLVIEARVLAKQLGVKQSSIAAMLKNGVLERGEGPKTTVSYVLKTSVCEFIQAFMLDEADLQYLTRKEIDTLKIKEDELEELFCGAPL